MGDQPIHSDPADAPGEERPFSSFIKYFLHLGAFGFGGPIATVGYMQRDLVEHREWLNREEFLNGVALGQTMPGPLAAQVAMWVGYMKRGAWGALSIALAFIAPSFIVVLTVAFFYVRFRGLDWVQGLFYGIAPGVLAIIAIAAVKLARLTNERDPRLWVISLVIMLVTAVTGTEVALLFVAAGALMILWDAPPRPLRRNRSVAVVPLAHGLLLGAGSAGTLAALAVFFLKSGAFIFGSGLAIVPFLHEGSKLRIVSVPKEPAGRHHNTQVDGCEYRDSRHDRACKASDDISYECCCDHHGAGCDQPHSDCVEELPVV